MSGPDLPYVLTRGALPLTASRVLVAGDVLTEADITLIGGAGEVERLVLMGLLERRTIVVVAAPKASAKADRALIADLQGQIAALAAGADPAGLQASLDRLTAERDAAVQARQAAEADDAVDAAATAEARGRAEAAEAALAVVAAEKQAAEQGRQIAAGQAAQALSDRTAERDRAEADLQAALRRIQVLESKIAAHPDPSIAAAEIIGLKTRIDSLTAERDTALAATADTARADALAAELAAAQAALADARAARDIAGAALAAAPGQDVLDNLTRDLAAARTETETVRTQMNVAEDAAAKARADAAEAAGAGMAALNQVAALETQIASLTEANTQLQTDLAAALKAPEYRNAPLEADQPANPAAPEAPAAADPATGG